jgi:pimeloyl-ACP methyl ester carboxylesterase
MSTARINGVSLYYEVYGRGEPLLLIMGLGASTLGWQNQIPFLSQHLRVIAYDNRGAGRSDKPEGEYTMALLADDAAALLDHLSIPSAHVYGVSLGGMIAQELVLRHPGKVHTLILGASSPCPMALPPSQKVLEELVSSSRLPPREAFEATIHHGYSNAFREAHPEYLWLRSQMDRALQPPPEAWDRQYQAATSHDTRDRLGQIGVPTLVITGDQDPLIVPENSRHLAEHVPGAQLVMLAGARHAFNVEFEEESNRLVLDFILRNSAPSAIAADAE